MTVVRIDVGDVAITIDPDAHMIQIDDDDTLRDENAVAPGCSGRLPLPEEEEDDPRLDEPPGHPTLDRMGFHKPC